MCPSLVSLGIPIRAATGSHREGGTRRLCSRVAHPRTFRAETVGDCGVMKILGRLAAPGGEQGAGIVGASAHVQGTLSPGRPAPGRST